jgi:hypothetical protein
MFNPDQLVIDGYIERLKSNYLHTYGILEPDFPNMIAFMGRLALENIANSDAPYHDTTHTIMVTDVGQEILRGMHLREGRVSPRDWLHFTIAALCHDIGYVRGVCKGDDERHYVINEEGQRVFLRPGATDASLAPHRVNRSKMFVRQRFAHVDQIDAQLVMTFIEHTRFPVPDAEIYRDTAGFPGLLRAADLIGEIADPSFLRNSAAHFAELEESGEAAELGFKTAADLRASYPRYFRETLQPLIKDGLRLLGVTHEGKQWLSNLYAQVYAEEHRVPTPGAERGATFETES